MMRWMWSGFTVWVELPAASWEGYLHRRRWGPPADGLFYGGGFTLLVGSDHDGGLGVRVYWDLSPGSLS